LKCYRRGERVVYVPRWKSQRERYERGELKEPVMCVMTPLTRGELKGYIQADAGDIEKVAAEIFEKHIVEIRNLSVGGKPVETGRALWELDDAPPELEELVSELLGALLDSSVLDEGALKK